MYVIQIRSQQTDNLVAVRAITQPATAAYRQQVAYDAIRAQSSNDDMYVVEYETDARGKRTLLNKYEFCC